MPFIKPGGIAGFLLLLLSSAIFGQSAFVKTNATNTHYRSASTFRAADAVIAEHHIEIPRVTRDQSITQHKGYCLCYNESCEQASWVAYLLTRERAVSHFSRTNHFLPDPMIATGSADDLDYKGSGYDRGHLAPAADMGWSSTTMAESFYYSNMSPQLPGFNRGVWKRLEELVRQWAFTYDSLYIVTGPILKNGLPYIGPHHVSVPEYYYKAILRLGPHPEGIAFVLPNQSSHSSLQAFAISIDSAESLTGIDFFAALPHEIEESIEHRVHADSWEWNDSTTRPENITGSHRTPSVSTLPDNKPTISTPREVSVQCSALTKSGSRCRRMTKNTNGLCWQHTN